MVEEGGGCKAPDHTWGCAAEVTDGEDMLDDILQIHRMQSYSDVCGLRGAADSCAAPQYALLSSVLADIELARSRDLSLQQFLEQDIQYRRMEAQWT